MFAGHCDDFNSDSWYFYTNLVGVLTDLKTWKQYKIEMDSMHPAQVQTLLVYHRFQWYSYCKIYRWASSLM